mgnify:CR=1 FL=1
MSNWQLVMALTMLALYTVILNGVKNLLAVYALCLWVTKT